MYPYFDSGNVRIKWRNTESLFSLPSLTITIALFIVNDIALFFWNREDTALQNYLQAYLEGII